MRYKKMNNQNKGESMTDTIKAEDILKQKVLDVLHSQYPLHIGSQTCPQTKWDWDRKVEQIMALFRPHLAPVVHQDTIKTVAEAVKNVLAPNKTTVYFNIDHEAFAVAEAAIGAMQIREMTADDVANYLRENGCSMQPYTTAEVLAKLGAIKIVGGCMTDNTDPRDELIKKLVGALVGSDKLIEDAQDIMRSNLIPDGISNKDAIAAYISLLDNTRQRKVQIATHEALAEAKQLGY